MDLRLWQQPLIVSYMSKNNSLYTNFPNGVASMGIPLPVVTQGNVWFVKPGTGSNSSNGKSPAQAFKTLAFALSQATANQNDVIYFFAESNTAANTTDYQSTTLTWNKDLVHLIGINAGPQISQRSRIAQLATVKTMENLFVVSANDCIIANVEIFQGVTISTAVAPVALTVSGSRNHFINCQASGNGDAAGSTDTSGARSLVVSGSENLFESSYFGLDTVIRTTQAAEVGFTGTPARNIFKDCIIDTYTSSTGFLPVTVAAGMDRFTIFKECMFLAAANITSAVAPAAVFGGSTASINGVIHLRNPYTNCTQYTAADSTRVVALGQNGLATGHLIGIAQGIDAA